MIKLYILDISIKKIYTENNKKKYYNYKINNFVNKKIFKF